MYCCASDRLPMPISDSPSAVKRTGVERNLECCITCVFKANKSARASGSPLYSTKLYKRLAAF